MCGDLPRDYTHGAFNITGQAWQQAGYVRQVSLGGEIAYLAIEIVLAGRFLAVTMIT